MELVSDQYNIQQQDCCVFLRGQLDNTIDLTITSPPYDNLRDYDNHNAYDSHTLGKELFRCTKDGGIACVIIQDATKDFAKSLTSFKLAIDWCNSGWKLFECCIYQRNGTPGNWWSKRFRVDHEYIMIFFKGDKPRFFDKSHMMVPCLDKYANKSKKITVRLADGTTKSNNAFINATKCPGTIWHYLSASQENFNANKIKKQHPATMPEKLTSDLIRCFSKPNDVVFDPFLGSGTVAVNAINLNRQFIGCEISEKYMNIIQQRIENETGKTQKI